MKVTNNSKAMQGVHTLHGIKYLKPGQTDDISFTEEGLKQAQRLAFLLIEDDASDSDLDREDLKKQANELGIEYARNITTEKLKELIDAKLAS
ncbi:hypothetical protein NAC44_11975 [Allorhizobium sp. BGMRC 0089]|uniref:hypothetical protein n=1 Tax=Allorhizobium sonneratiae TaxID=2934936 RepID=UPI002033634D|nr:hypothetical protein [Allorhizobium sonneratiae]MCM2293040.1 hypothetical protein [Allorhizobium sonneratiae]